MTVTTKTIGRLPLNKGDWNPNYVNPKTGLDGYGLKFRAIRYGCEVESKMENNTYDPFAWDGDETFTLDDAHWRLISGNPKVWAAGNPKPASTGTTGDYPYNGMGRVVLKKNMVGGVNTLTQDMFYKGEPGSRVPNTNTIFVIQYDFVLGENITMPANCVLDFEGGSISGDYRVISNNTEIIGKLPNNPDVFMGAFYHDGKPLNYNLKVTKPLETTLLYAFMNPALYVGYLLYPQDIVSFYYNQTKYYLLFGNIESSNPQRAFFMLFDENYEFKGSNESPYSCHGNLTYANDKIYTVNCNNNGTLGIAVYNVSEIVNKCISEYSSSPHSDLYSNKPVSIDFIDIPAGVIDYDATNKQFVLINDEYFCSIYDKDFNKIKDVNIKPSIDQIESEINQYLTIQGVVIKNGIILIDYWVNDYKKNTNDRGNNLIISYDVINNNLISWEYVKTPYMNPEIEGLFKDSDDDNTVLFLTGGNTETGSCIVGIHALTQVNSLYGIQNKKESADNLANKQRLCFTYIDNTYDYSRGRATGSSLRPYKTIDEALAMSLSNNMANEFRIKGSSQNYIIPTIRLSHDRLEFVKWGETTPVIEGNVWNFGGNLFISNIILIGKAISEFSSVIRTSAGGFTILDSVEIRGNDAIDGMVATDCAQIKLEGSTLFKNCNTGIAIHGGANFAGGGSFKDCAKGFKIESCTVNLTDVSFDNVTTCFDVDETKINISSYTNISCTNCTKIVKKDWPMRRNSNFTFSVLAPSITDFLEVFMRNGSFNASTVSLILPEDTTYQNVYLPRGEYVYNDTYFRYCGNGYDLIKLIGNNTVAVPIKGTTAQRPTPEAGARNVGFQYFDTDLNKQIFWNGTIWVDATGTSV